MRKSFTKAATLLDHLLGGGKNASGDRAAPGSLEGLGFG
jgi:hypothetical protein